MVCPACGEEALLRREPVYDGFRKSGERLSCPLCGHLFSSEEEVPFKPLDEAPRVFTEADRTPSAQVFDEDGEIRFCRRCAEYIVNPFMQYCAVHKREVQATDTCEQFHPGVDSGMDGK